MIMGFEKESMRLKPFISVSVLFTSTRNDFKKGFHYEHRRKELDSSPPSRAPDNYKGPYTCDY